MHPSRKGWNHFSTLPWPSTLLPQRQVSSILWSIVLNAAERSGRERCLPFIHWQDHSSVPLKQCHFHILPCIQTEANILGHSGELKVELCLASLWACSGTAGLTLCGSWLKAMCPGWVSSVLVGLLYVCRRKWRFLHWIDALAVLVRSGTSNSWLSQARKEISQSHKVLSGDLLELL